MKKYNQPELQVVELAPMAVLCASITEGPGAGEDIVVGH